MRHDDDDQRPLSSLPHIDGRNPGGAGYFQDQYSTTAVLGSYR